MNPVAIDTAPAAIPVSDNEVSTVVDDIFNEMDATFDSPVVKRNVHRLFGKRGMKSGRTIEEFDVHSREAKSEQDLSGVLVLGCAAGTALQRFFAEKGTLPVDILPVNVRIALALPISEYKTKRKQYVNIPEQNMRLRFQMVQQHYMQHVLRQESDREMK